MRSGCADSRGQWSRSTQFVPLSQTKIEETAEVPSVKAWAYHGPGHTTAMTTLDSSICWAVLAPLPAAELRRVAEGEWEHDFPYAIDPAVGGGGRAGPVRGIDLPFAGSEGGDHHFAEIFSTLAWNKHVYSLWLDPKREQILEWENCRQSASSPEGDPLEFPESLASKSRAARQRRRHARRRCRGRSVHDVRRASRHG